ncbi:MAG TPA: 4'-phosphopantetheinyl transferase superfamily protein [Thermoanaerobaculia bacterium]|nr:4'-phosphopantetheinyl transferase superfamily protein [Thermoanaerobaculia bacterium]
MTDVHLHWIDVPSDGYDALLSRIGDLLSAEELARANRFRFEPDRVLFATAHAFLRTLLPRYTDSELTFVEMEKGKPELRDRSVRFNLSHTRGLVLVGITATADLGVDVERIDERDLEGLAKRVYTEREISAWKRDPEWFFDHWTLKESYIKARGLGLSLDLKAFGFTEDGPRLECAPEFDDAAGWQFTSFAPTPRHRAAAAIRIAAGSPVRWITAREEFPSYATRTYS